MRSNVIFKLCDLKKLTDDEDSCVEVCKHCCRTLKFLPSQTRNLKQSVKELLDSAIGSYDSELNGIILNFKNIKVQPFTKLVDDGYLAVTYKGDIYIFNPKIGSILKGIVNKKSDDHIGVLVHSVFNVVIPRPANKSFSSWTGSQLNIGDNVVFKVNEVNFGSPLLYIRGNFIDSDSNTDCDLTDSGIEGNDQYFNDPNPNDISKLIHPDCSSNEDEAASLTQVIPSGHSVQSEKLCLDKHSECDKEVCGLYERDSDKMGGISNITYRKQNLEETKRKLLKESLTNISDKKKQVLNNKDDGKTRLKETLSPTEDKDNFQAKKAEENSKSPEKSLKTNAFMKANSNPQKKLAENSSYSLEDKIISKGKLLKIGSPVNLNTSTRKTLSENSSSSEGEINQHKLLEIKSPKKHNTSTKKLSAGNSNSSKDDDIDQHSKSLEVKSPVKRNTSARKSSLGNSSSSEDDNIQYSKLLKIKSSVKHNTFAQKLSTEDSTSSEDENYQQTKLPEVNSSVKHFTFAQKPSTEDSSSSEDENDQHTKLLEVNSAVKYNTSAQKPSVENVRFLENLEIQKVSFTKDTGRKHKESNLKRTIESSLKHKNSRKKCTFSEDDNNIVKKLNIGIKNTKHSLEKSKLSSKGINIKNDILLKLQTSEDQNKPNILTKKKEIAMGKLKQNGSLESGTTNPSGPLKADVDNNVDLLSVQNRKGKKTYDLSLVNEVIDSGFISKLKKKKKKHKTDKVLSDFGSVGVIENKNHSNKKNVLDVETKSLIDQLDLRYEKNLPKIKAKKHKKSNMEVAYVNQPSSNHKEGDKLVSGVSMKKENKKNVLGVETKFLIDQLDLRLHKPSKIKAKKHKKSNMEVDEYVSEPSSVHKEGEKLLSGVRMKKANKQNVLGVETKSLIDQVDLRHEDNPPKVKAKKHKMSNMEVAYVSEPSSNHKESDKLLSGITVKKANKQHVLEVGTKSLIDHLDLRHEDNSPKVKAKKHKMSNMEVEYVSEPSSVHKEGEKLLSGVSMKKANKQNVLGVETKSLIDQVDLRHEDNPPKVKAKKHKMSNMEVAYVSEPSSNHKESDKLLSGITVKKANKQHVLEVGTKSLIDHLDLRHEDNSPKVKAKKHKMSNMEVAYVSEPSSNHKESDKLVSGITVKKANKHVLEVGTKSLIDHLDLRLEDNPPKNKAKKHKKSNMEVEYVSEPSSVHKEGEKLLSDVSMKKANKKRDKTTVNDHENTFDLLNLQLKENLKTNIVSECLTKVKKKKLKNRGTTELVEKEDSLNKYTEKPSDLISLLLAKAAIDIKENSPQTNKRKHAEKKDKKKCKKKMNELVTEDGTSDLLKDVFKSSKSDGIEQNNIESLDASDMNKKSLSKKNIKRTISMESKEIIPSISKAPKVHKKKKRKNELSLNEMTSALLTKALIKLNKTVPKTYETSVTNTKEDKMH